MRRELPKRGDDLFAAECVGRIPMRNMRKLTDTELDAVCGGGHRSSNLDLNFQTNRSRNLAVTVHSHDVNIIQGSNINGGVLQIA